MATAQLISVLRHLRRLQDAHASDERRDSELLERFVTGHDEAAFQSLVARHGPMVLALCRRLLGDMHDAEDAFQATFLVLAHKAHAIRKRASVGSWLYSVAQRLALEARVRMARRRKHERAAALHNQQHLSHREVQESSKAMHQVIVRLSVPLDPAAEAGRREVQAVLDEELGRLPEKYRAAVVLCYLEGKTNDEAARQLAWPAGTLKKRLARARALLRIRRACRGLALSTATLTALLTSTLAQAHVSRLLLTSTTRAALQFAAAQAAPGAVSAEAVALAKGVLQTMKLSKLKLIAFAAFLVALLSTGVALVLQAPAAPPVPAQPDRPAGQELHVGEPWVPVRDLHGDPLPPGALARLGTVRWRQGNQINFVDFLPGSRQVLSVGVDGIVRVWDVDSGKEIRRFGKPHVALPPGSAAELENGIIILDSDDSTRSTVTVSSDRKTLAVWDPNEGVVRCWDIASGKLTRQIKGMNSGTSALSFSPDGKLLAWSDANGISRVWDLVQDRQLHQFSVFIFGGVRRRVAPAFSPDSKALATVVTEVENEQPRAVIKVWDLASGKELRKIELEATPDDPRSLTFSSDGKKLAWFNVYGVIHLVDAASGKLLGKIETKGQEEQVDFAVDGKTLLTHNASDRLLRLWDVATGKQLRQPIKLADGARVGGPLTSDLALSPDGKLLAWGTKDSVVHLLDLSTGKEVQTGGHQGTVSSLIYARDGKTLATSSPDGTVRSWEAATGKEVGQVKLPSRLNTVALLNAVALSPDGQHLAINPIEKSNEVVPWDVAAGKPLHRLEGYPDGISTFAFAPDNKMLAVRVVNKPVVKLFDVATGKALRSLVMTGDGLRLGRGSSWLVFSPDGKRLAIRGNAETIVVWETATGQEVCRLKESSTTRGAAFSPDGRMLALDMGDNNAVLWELASGKKRCLFGVSQVPLVEKQTLAVQQFETPPGVSIGAAAVTEMAFSPDGTLLAQVGWDQSVRLWDVASGKQLNQFLGHQGEITSLAFAPDGRTLATSSADTTVLVWNVAGARATLKQAPAVLTAEQADAHWVALAGEDAMKAYASVCALAADPARAVPLLRQRLRPVPAPDGKRIAELITALDSKQFTTRKAATEDLQKLGDLAVGPLRKALSDAPSLEMRQRLEQLLGLAAARKPDAEELRVLRALEVLERLNTAESRQVLQVLAEGAEGARITTEAREALARRRR